MKRGFTLIELLLCLAILGIVASIVAPAVMQGRQRHRAQVLARQ